MAQLGCEVMHKSMRKVINVLKGVRRWKEPEPTVKTFSETLNALDDVKLFSGESWILSRNWHDQLSQRCCGMYFRLQVLQLYLLQQLHKGLCTSTKDFHKHKDLCPLHFTKLARSQTAPLITIILSHHHPINLCTILLNLLFLAFSCISLFLLPLTTSIINGYSF